jgi:hypothetical protein
VALRALTDETAGRWTVWTIYRELNDYPGCWVLRAHDIFPGVGTRANEFCFVAMTLNELRAKVPPGTLCIGRIPEDDGAIYESWVGVAPGPGWH